jgi:Overcoming lysogenization defect protein-like, TOPRIM domain
MHHTDQARPGEAVDVRTVVLVEGVSDQRAVETLARRRGRDLGAEGVRVIPMGGATNIRTFVARFGPQGAGLRLAGLCDAAEEPVFRAALEAAGLGSGLTRDRMEALGFFVCHDDLEDELIRALGPDAVERVIGAQGDLGRFRTLQKQPAQRGRTVEAQLHRFMGSGGSRKIRYGSLLVEALDGTDVPRVLDRLLESL